MCDAVSCGLQPQPWHHSTFGLPLSPIFQNLTPYLHMYNCVRVHPYAHQQHMKVLNHFLYIQYGCGMQPVVVYSLNHDTITSYGLHLTPIFQNLPPTCTGITASTVTPQHIWALPYPNFPKFDLYLHRYNSVRVHPYAHPQHMKVLNHFLYIQYGCGMQ